MSDPLRGLDPASKGFVVASGVLLTLVLALALYAAFFLEGPITIAPRVMLGLFAVGAYLWAWSWFSRALNEAIEHSRNAASGTQQQIRDARKRKSRQKSH